MTETRMKELIKIASNGAGTTLNTEELTEILDGYLMYRYMERERNYVLYCEDAEKNIRKMNAHWLVRS